MLFKIYPLCVTYRAQYGFSLYSVRLVCCLRVCMFCMCAVCMRYCTYFTHSLFFSMKFDTITAFVMDKMWLGFSNIQPNTHTDMYTRCSVWFLVLFVYVFLIFFLFVYFLYPCMCVISMKRIKKLPDRVGSQSTNNVIFVFVNNIISFCRKETSNQINWNKFSNCWNKCVLS